MEHSKSFKRSNTSKKDLIWQKPSIRGFDKERGEKGSGFKFSCFKISLKEKEKKVTWQRPYILESIATLTSSALFLSIDKSLQVRGWGGSTRPLDLLSTDILAPGPVHGCPEAPLQLCCAGEMVQRMWQLIFSFEIRIHAGYFKVWPGISVGRRGLLGVIWPLGTGLCFFFFFSFVWISEMKEDTRWRHMVKKKD